MTEYRFDFRIYYEDTDAGGVVYNANYLKFAERARTEMLRELGFIHAEFTKETGAHFLVRACSIDYQGAAYLDDALNVRTSVVKIGGSSMDLKQDVYRDDTLLVGMNITLVCVNSKGAATRVPDNVREILK